MTSKERDPMWDFEIKDKLIYLWTTIVNLYGEIGPLESYQEENKIRARKCCEHILNHLERLEMLEKNSDKVIKDSVKLINKNLELQARLGALENKNETLNKALDIAKIDYTTTRINLDNASAKIKDLQQENEKLKKALDEACKMLSWDCPCGQDLIDDLDCENHCQPDIDYSECWMKYFIKEVLGNET